VKECPHDAITIDNFLAFIHDDKCKLCRKCVPVCPTNCILELNFPPKKEKPAKVAAPVKEKVAEKPEATTAKVQESKPEENKEKLDNKTSDNKLN